MQNNSLKALWARGEPAINAWLSIANGFSAEIVARQGYDSVTIDMQHGMIDFAGAVTMLQGLQGLPVTPLVRVPWLEPSIIMKSLDAGAWGVICPMIDNREQAARLVECVRYPPAGRRSFGPTRVILGAGPDYPARANDEVICLAMIETAEAMANLDEIAATPGLDGLYIGPSDLTLGITDGRLPPGVDREEEEMLEAIGRICEAAHRAGIRACLHCLSPDYAARGVAMGFDLVTLASDVNLLRAAAATSVARARELIGEG